MPQLSQKQIFKLRPIVKNFATKKSAYIRDRDGRNILCLVDDKNRIFLHATVEYGVVGGGGATGGKEQQQGESSNRGNSSRGNVVKTISWFQAGKKRVQDLCFDPSGTMLLVLCYENTLHTIPVTWLLDRLPSHEQFHLAAEKITSFIVPFAGPHECPNSKTCPNNLIASPDTESGRSNPYFSFQAGHSSTVFESTFSDNDFNTIDDRDLAANGMYNSFFAIGEPGTNNNSGNNEAAPDACGQQGSGHADGNNGNPERRETVDPCPYPTSVVWWKTLDGKHCAIVGYSDGTICIVGLEPHCPLVAHTNIERGAVVQMFICRDTILSNVTLMINSSAKEQWKLLLEQKSIGYVFPGAETTSTSSEHFYSASSSRQSSEELANYKNQSENVATNKSAADAVAADWKIVIPLNRGTSDQLTTEPQQKQSPLCLRASAPNDLGDVDSLVPEPTPSPEFVSGILPSARSRLASLKELGVKKIGALKMKLAENRIKIQDKERYKEHASAFAVMDVPVMNPEILTTPAGPFFIVQYVRNKYLLSAIHSYSDTLSVHSMDISLIPLCIYKIPKNCKDLLITPNLMFTILDCVEESVNSGGSSGKITDENTNQNGPRFGFNAGVVASNTSELRIGEDSEFQNTSMLSLFQFVDEHLIGLYRVADDTSIETDRASQNDINDSQRNNNYMKEMRYMKTRKKSAEQGAIDEDNRRFLRTEFPQMAQDKCVLVTDRNVYLIELRDTPERVFGALAKESEWDVCEEFCKVFNVNFAMCIEYTGDELLRIGQTRHALQCYNVARIPSVKTALKLAMFGENNALMHLCAMALKTLYILKSTHPLSYHINHLADLQDPRFGGNTPEKTLTPAQRLAASNSGLLCTDFSYENDEAVTDLQMSNSSQFHLSNLLLLTLTEKTIKDKKCMPLWNFLATNKKYHSNMTSIVLCQSGLYYASVLLACARGAHLDAYCGLVGVSSQEFGWYNELNSIMCNLSEPMFMECIIYMYSVSLDYFGVIQNKIDQIELSVLEKLRLQLDPFSAVFRPVVSQLELSSTDVEPEYISFCKSFIETFLLIIIKLYSLQTPNDRFVNALSSLSGHHEENQFAITVQHNSPLSAGFSHCACIVDGVAYAWGSNGVNCLLGSCFQSDSGDGFCSPRPLQFLSNINLVVHAVRCGRTHTLILTNNGLYSTGANQLGQLGIGMYTALALHPMLIRDFDGKNIELIQAGQYHNAVVAGGVLYTWGWGVYGQLGHGDVEVVYTPKEVAFFSDVNIRQIALGHAHTVVLGSDAENSQHIYVFGSNHYGQLGLGQTHSTILKSLVPVVLSIAKPIRLIHTKFFTNFIVTEDNELYVWGSSPQALRLQYQAKKRANATRKHEEEAARQAAAALASVPPVVPTHPIGLAPGESFQTENVDNFEMVFRVSSSEPESIAEEPTQRSASPTEDTRPPRSKSLNDLDDVCEPKPLLKCDSDGSPSDPAKVEQNTPNGKIKSRGNSLDEDVNDHMYPTLVDTTEVQGNIVQVSCGLYHHAIISEHRKLFTWGKNLEKQLGRDRSQYECLRPNHLETIEDAVHVECGADFTLIMCGDLTVKAFGNSSFGQCGRDIAPDKNGIVGKLVRLRISKRVVRIPDSTQCIEFPVNINLPRPQINLNYEPVRYMKSVPAFDRRFIVKSELFDEGQSVDNDLTPLDPDTLVASCISSADSVDQTNKYPNEFIHYCLFIFHGIYNAQHLLDRVQQTEFKVRILMLNYNIKEAFSLCIAETCDAPEAIKTFEYFTKDLSVVPIHREDLKFLIYALFMHFIRKELNVQLIEQFFIADLDHYLFALAYILFFNNNNTDIERQVLVKFADLFGDEINHNDAAEALEKSEQIFNVTSTSFKTTVCQKLFDYEDNFA